MLPLLIWRSWGRHVPAGARRRRAATRQDAAQLIGRPLRGAELEGTDGVGGDVGDGVDGGDEVGVVVVAAEGNFAKSCVSHAQDRLGQACGDEGDAVRLVARSGLNAGLDYVVFDRDEGDGRNSTVRGGNHGQMCVSFLDVLTPHLVDDLSPSHRGPRLVHPVVLVDERGHDWLCASLVKAEKFRRGGGADSLGRGADLQIGRVHGRDRAVWNVRIPRRVAKVLAS